MHLYSTSVGRLIPVLRFVSWIDPSLYTYAALLLWLQALKRKVDDVNKKLEALQDLLRENKLSQSTIQGLAYISQGINIHTCTHLTAIVRQYSMYRNMTSCMYAGDCGRLFHSTHCGIAPKHTCTYINTCAVCMGRLHRIHTMAEFHHSKYTCTYVHMCTLCLRRL